MAIKQTTGKNKSRKQAFYKRKGFWFMLFFLGAVFSAFAGMMAYQFVMQYTREYRLRADRYDMERINDLEIPSLIVDRHGKEIGRIFVQNRSLVSIDAVPEIFIDALRAGEDQRFYSHDGVDYIGVVRAVYLNWKAGETTQGASTVTQQLARNAYDLEGERRRRNERGMQRKIVEAFLAQRIEKHYSKRQILEFYLNRIYFGSGFYGIRSASLGYFGKEPRNLTALESAAIVGCIKNPTNLSPLNNKEGNRKSRNLVLGRMVDLGAISGREARELMKANLRLNPKPLQRGTSHLYERIADAVSRVMGDEGLVAGGYKIYTTILAEAQFAAEKQLEQCLRQAEAHPGYSQQKHADYRKSSDEPATYVQGACLMVEQATGEVLVHVGGRDYAQVPYDFIEAGKRPLGTAFFPFIYAAALEKGSTPVSLLEDVPMDNRSVMVGGREGILGEWGMEVANPVYEGKIPLRRALESSKIGATVRLADEVGIKNVIDFSSRFGFPWKDAELLRRVAVGFEAASLTQAVRAISVFAQGGQLGPESLVYLDRIQDSKGRAVYQRKSYQREKRLVLNQAAAWQVHHMMAGSMERGSAMGSLKGMAEQPFLGAAKGGSTHDFSDCWFLGYNSKVTCGVWTGFLNGNGQAIYPGAFSRDLAMPVWQAAMNAATQEFHGEQLPIPKTIVTVPVCSKSGQRATQFCQEYVEEPGSKRVHAKSMAINEYFQAGHEQRSYCQVHSGVDAGPQALDLTLLDGPGIDVVPVRAKEPVLLGEDPYHSVVQNAAVESASPGLIRQRTNVLDSLDLRNLEKDIELPKPTRLEIQAD